MGWLKGNSKKTTPSETVVQNLLSRIAIEEREGRSPEDLEVAPTEEMNSGCTQDVEKPVIDFKEATQATPDIAKENHPARSLEDLPFIEADEVRRSVDLLESGSQERLLLVVDQIVYNCTDFVQEHPGGDTVIRSFAGKDCSWQFWRFHNSQIMEEWGGPLRIGRTKGVENPYKERPRFVGLRKFGGDF